MRESHLQTPQRDQSSANGRLKSTPALKRSSLKVTKKSLTSESPNSGLTISDENYFNKRGENLAASVCAFETPTSKSTALPNLTPPSSSITCDESVVLDGSEKPEIPTIDYLKEVESVEAVNVTECLKEARIDVQKSNENLIFSVCTVGTPASKAIALQNLTSPSSSISFYESVVLDGSEKSEIPRVDSFEKIECVEAATVIEYLKEARIEVLKSNDLGSSKSLLYAMINIIVKEFSGVYEKKNWLHKLLLRKGNMVFLTVMMWILVIVGLWFFRLGQRGLPNGPLPT